jgi:acetolactate synthase-1/2/3 large subunit
MYRLEDDGPPGQWRYRGRRVCFANPEMAELHFVASLDSVPEMRDALGCSKASAPGPRTGYGRMADKLACTFLYLGPGLANGLANLHNARRHGSPVVNIVGDHATYHKQYDTANGYSGFLGSQKDRPS